MLKKLFGNAGPGISPEEFSGLSAQFVYALEETFRSQDRTTRVWPMSGQRDTYIQALWKAAAEAAGPQAAAYQPDRLSVEIMREDDHLLALMLLPGLSGAVCFSAGVWLFGPVNPEAADFQEGASPRFFVMGEDQGADSEARLYELANGELLERGQLAVADIGLFMETVVGRYLKGRETATVKSGSPEMAEAMEKARSLVPYFVETLETYPAVESYSVKTRIEDEGQVEYFWLENTRFENGVFRGTLGNDPTQVRNVVYGQEITVAPDQIFDWYYLWEGKMRGNYTLRAGLPYMDPDQAAKFTAILDDV